jgi:hypothetical protein
VIGTPSAPKATGAVLKISVKVVDHPEAKRVEAAGAQRHVVEQDRGEHDPHHRPEREDGSGGDGVERETERKMPARHRDGEPDDEPRERRLPRGAARPAEQHEYDENRQSGHRERRPERVRDGCEQLMEHVASRVFDSWCCLSSREQARVE